jgi:hypothetical protein
VIFTAAVAGTPAQDLPPVDSSTFTVVPAAVSVDEIPDVLVGPGSGMQVSRLLSGADGSTLASGYPFGPDFPGGVRVASGDVNGDGVPDPIVGTGPGSAEVRVYSGSDISFIVGGRPFGPGFNGGVYVAAGDLDNDGRADIIVGQGEGGGAVSVFRADSTLIATLTPFGAGYMGGVRVAAGDVTGDGVADLLTAQATGGLVTIISGATGAPVVSASPYGSIPGGVFAATGDVTGDGVADVIVAPGSGNAPVLLFDLANGQAIGSFAAYDAGFTGGVRVAVGDLDGDQIGDIITGAGPTGSPLVRAFRYNGGAVLALATFQAYDPNFGGGVFVAGGDVDGDGIDEILTSPGPGHTPLVRALRVSGSAVTEVASFLAYDPGMTAGIHVAAADISGDRVAEIVVGPAVGVLPTRVFSLDAGTATPYSAFYSHGSTHANGVFVAAGDVTGDGIAEVIAAVGPGSEPWVVVLAVVPPRVKALFIFLAYDPTFTVGVRVAAADLPDSEAVRFRETFSDRGRAPALRLPAASRLSSSTMRAIPPRRIPPPPRSAHMPREVSGGNLPRAAVAGPDVRVATGTGAPIRRDESRARVHDRRLAEHTDLDVVHFEVRDVQWTRGALEKGLPRNDRAVRQGAAKVVDQFLLEPPGVRSLHRVDIRPIQFP